MIHEDSTSEEGRLPDRLPARETLTREYSLDSAEKCVL